MLEACRYGGASGFAQPNARYLSTVLGAGKNPLDATGKNHPFKASVE
jgi:hypothetical protein